MKKKQPDFQKVKLRAKKTSTLLPKGKNVTSTAFKSKKIVTREQKLKISADVNLKELLARALQPNVSQKSTALKYVGTYVEKNIDTLKSYFFDILNTIGRVLLDSNSSIRTQAIDLIEKCLECLTATQIECFLETLTSQLNCMMTHMDISVKKDSLDLLGILLKSAPFSVCYSKKVLPNLLDMISSRKPQKKKTPSPKKRKLEDNINSSMTAIEWRDRVMTLILEILQSLVGSHKEQKPIFQEEQRVYLDRKKLIGIPLYAGGGLKPAKVEFPSLLIKSDMQIADQLRLFLGDLVKVSSDIITEEMTAHRKILPSESIEHISIITQILCCIGKYFKLQESQLDEEFLRMMHQMINKKLMMSFPYSMHESVSKKSRKKPGEMTCLHLNLGISYLFSTFILGTEFCQPEAEKKIIFCLLDAMGYGFTLDDKSILLILDTLKCFIQDISLCSAEERNKYEEEISEIFNALNDFIINSKDEELKTEVQNLFIDIVLNYDFQMFLEYEGIKNWINFNFSQIKHKMSERKIDKDAIKCINQMCNREYLVFMDILNKSDVLELLEYLKFENEDFQFMIMNLITHMTNLPLDFLQDVADFILCDHSISVQTISKLIRLLCARFSDERIPEKEAEEFVKFLLNISYNYEAVANIASEVKALNQIVIQDSRTIREEDMLSENSQQCDTGEHQQHDPNQNNSLKNLLLHVQDKCTYRIMPSKHWKRHLDIFEVCLVCLLSFKDRKMVANCTTAFLSELLAFKVTLPVQSAIALMEISSKVYADFDFLSDSAQIILNELSLASLFYISVVTHKVPQHNNVKKFCVQRLQDSLFLNRSEAIMLLKLLVNKLYEQGLDELNYLYFLRIISFFIARQYADCNLMSIVYSFVQSAKDYCPENSLAQAYAFQIYDYCHSLSS